MNILVLSTMFPNAANSISGIFIFNHVKALIALGVNVTVVSPVPYTFFPINKLNKKWERISKIPKVEFIDGIYVIHTNFIAIPNGLFKDLWAFSYVKSASKKIEEIHKKNPFQLIHAHGSLPDDHAAQLLSKKLNIPYIITVHGYTINELYKKRSFYRSKDAILKADAVIGISDKVTSKIKLLTGRESGVFKVLNGFNFNTNYHSAESPNNTIRIMFGGNMVESKGCEYLLKAFEIINQKYDNVILDIAGGGILLSKMIQLAEDLKLSHKTNFYGRVTNRKMIELMSRCDIFILPSFDEGFGIVYLEAMSLKKPVIGTEGEGISEIIIDGVNGLLVKPKNVESIVEKLSLLILSSSLRKEIGIKGFESIKGLTWEKNARSTLNIYEQVLNSNRENEQ